MRFVAHAKTWHGRQQSLDHLNACAVKPRAAFWCLLWNVPGKLPGSARAVRSPHPDAYPREHRVKDMQVCSVGASAVTGAADDPDAMARGRSSPLVSQAKAPQWAT
jgi:hypothetical protein